MGTTRFDFTDKVALVTGAASGIGRETALEFAGSGASVVVSDVDKVRGQKIADEIKRRGGNAVFIVCDVSKEKQVIALVAKTVARYGKLNIVCNDAGIEGVNGITTKGTLQNFEQVIDINLKGMWLCLKYQIPELIKAGGGSIVNLSSIAGLIGFPGLPAYVASKHGVIGLTKTAALEYADKNVRVNAVCPGPIMTPMLERIMKTTPGFREQITAGVPEHRIGQPKDVAQAILFLSTDQASYITGQSLAIDGGWVAQ